MKQVLANNEHNKDRMHPMKLFTMLCLATLAITSSLNAKLPARQYDFSTTTSDKHVFPDQGIDCEPLSYQPNDEKLTYVPGRLPGRKAIRLDKAQLIARPFDIANAEGFTAQAWIKLIEPGTHRGNNNATCGTIMSIGVGYWDGWRLTTRFPDTNLSFELGRPKGINAFGVRSKVGLTPNNWHHVAVSWDKKTMRIYLDGLLCARRDYSDPYTQPEPNARFIVGYAGYGFGSAVMDVDEVVVHRSTFPPRHFMATAFSLELAGKSLPEPLAKHFDELHAALDKQDTKAVLNLFATLLKHPLVNETPALAASLKLHAYKYFPTSFPIPVDDITSDRIPESLREKIVFTLLKSIANNPDAQLSSKIVNYLLQRKDLTPLQNTTLTILKCIDDVKHDKSFDVLQAANAIRNADSITDELRLDFMLRFAHAARSAGRYDDARKLYLTIANAKDDSTLVCGIATLAYAQTYMLQKDWDKARDAFLDIAQDKRLLPYHRQEAAECAEEARRLKNNQDPIDAEATRKRPKPLAIPKLAVFVEPTGNDDNDGSPEKPVATPARALQLIRQLRANAPAQPAAIVLRNGTYHIAESLVLEPTDSGTPEAPFIIMAQPGHKPVLYGGTRLRQFISETDPAILARLPKGKRIPLLVCDLNPAYSFDTNKRPTAELFCNGKPLTPARYPNTGFVNTGAFTDDEAKPPVFEYTDSRPESWKQANDLWVTGYWRHLWSVETYKVNHIDTDARRIALQSVNHYGLKSNMPYFYFNLLEEIDQPGEWFLDRTNKKVYLYPNASPRATYELSTLQQPFIAAQDIDFLTIHGITFNLSQANAVTIKKIRGLRFSANTISRIAGDALVISDATDSTIYGNDFFCLGRGGIRISGGDRKTLTPGNVNVENNWFRDFSRIDRSYTPAVLMNGVGNRIAHNLMHDAPHHAIRLEGNDHVIEYNEVHSVVYESDDQAGIDMWSNPSYRGNVMRYNFWHHIGSGRNIAGQAGIRLDDAICGVLMYSNIFLCSADGSFGAIQIHAGKENIADNNLFIACQAAISFSTWGTNNWLNYLHSDTIQKKLHEHVNIDAPPYSTKYPSLKYLEQDHCANAFVRNLVVRCGATSMRSLQQHTLLDNFVSNDATAFYASTPEEYAKAFGMEQWRAFQRQTAVRPIPFQLIGIYDDPNRASKPDLNVGRTITPNYHGTLK